jgi:hypothetical protein
MPCFHRLVVSILPRNAGIIPQEIHVGFAVEILALRHGAQYVGCLLSVYV